MSMLDELDDQPPPPHPGPLCVLQKIRVQHGDDMFMDVLQVCLSPRHTTTQKEQVLRNHGFNIHRQTIERHNAVKLKANLGCVRCRECLS